MLAVPAFAADRPQPIRLPLRSRIEAFKGSGQWEEVRFSRDLSPVETAIVICDMWDKHWCRGATDRVEILAKKAGPVLDRARERGILIVHAPSDTMDFYKDAPQRRAIQSLTRVTPPSPAVLADPPLPIDDSDGGCDTGDKNYKAWSRQHAAIRIAPTDLISDNGTEIYTALKLRGITNLLVMGVHTNMCILNRTFAIKQMTKWGIRCALVRDLTDAMYDPQDAPYVSHQQGTELVIQHIEKYWCPTTLSTEVMRALDGGTMLSKQ